MAGMARCLRALGSLVLLSSSLLGCVIGDDGGDDAAQTSGVATGVDGTGVGTGGPCFESPSCDPLAPSCSGSTRCVPNNGSFVCTEVPPETNEASVGEPCSGVLDCAEGSVCAAVGVPGCDAGGSCCAAVCDLEAPQCPGGTTCTPYAPGGSTLCYDHVGVCVIGS